MISEEELLKEMRDIVESSDTPPTISDRFQAIQLGLLLEILNVLKKKSKTIEK